MSGNQIYVGGLRSRVTEEDLAENFSKIGEITNIKLVKDENGLSKRFAFITFRTNEEAARAIETMHDRIICDSHLNVCYRKFNQRNQRKNFHRIRPTYDRQNDRYNSSYQENEAKTQFDDLLTNYNSFPMMQDSQMMMPDWNFNPSLPYNQVSGQMNYPFVDSGNSYMNDYSRSTADDREDRKKHHRHHKHKHHKHHHRKHRDDSSDSSSSSDSGRRSKRHARRHRRSPSSSSSSDYSD